jgi:hypothetical protein
LAVAIAVGAILSRYSLLSTRPFDPDELEHVHVAWSIAQGGVPYRDFFEMHPPLLHALMAPVVRAFDTVSPDSAIRALVVLRTCTWAISGVIVLCTFVLARVLRDAETAFIAMPLIATDIVLAHRGLEIRPDGLATVCWLCCLMFLHRCLTLSSASTQVARRAMALSGFCMGVGVLTSQKLLLAGPPLLALIVWYVTSDRFGASQRDRLKNAACMVAGCAVPWLGALAYFAAHHCTGAFLTAILFQDLGWKSESTALTVLTFVQHYDPWLFGLAAGGACLLVREAITDRRTRPSTVVLLLTAGSMFVGLFLIPVPFPQYCLTFTPLMAILAASWLVSASRVLRDRDGGPWVTGVWLAALTSVVVLAVVGLRAAHPVVAAPLVYPIAVVGAVGAMLLIPLHRSRELALGAVLLVLSVYPAQWTIWMRAERDDGQSAALRYVLSHSGRDAIVMDGWSGLGVFRQHAWYYWMLHPGVRAMLPAGAVERLTSDLEAGRLRPDIVILDSHLMALSPEITRVLQARYRPSDVAPIYVPKAALAELAAKLPRPGA